MRLDEFLIVNHAEIVQRCRVKVAARRAPRPTTAPLERGIQLFLEQRVEGATTTGNGGDPMRSGRTIGQLVHDYGDVRQSVTDLAIERGAPISPQEFQTLNRCLDDALTDAVTEFSRLRDLGVASEGTERLAILAHEVRNALCCATLAFTALKTGQAGVTSATGAVLERSLSRLNLIINRTLAGVRLETSVLNRDRVEVHSLLEEIELSVTPIAKARGIHLSVAAPAETSLAVECDSQLLSAVVANLVQNAIKFTRPHTHVALSAHATDGRIQIDVADECGGLAPGTADSLFRPFAQRGTDRSGLGLGLTIARRGAEAYGGRVHVRNVAGIGCVFTVDLPQAA